MTQAPDDASGVSNRSPAVEFLAALFNGTSDEGDGGVYLSSLPNERDDPLEPIGERHVCPPSGEEVDRFVHRWDRPKRGLFVCVGTVADTKRTKDNVRETVCLHADVDFKNLAEDEPTIRAALATLPTPPSIIVRSGNGLHLYWLFREPVDTQPNLERLEAALRKLADAVGGDPAVCHVAALMRLPGTHNTKRGDFREVKIEHLNSDVRYELEDLEDWLDEQRPVLGRKDKIGTEVPGAGFYPSQPADDNPYLKHAREWGYKPRIDVEAALAAMVEGVNVHTTLRDVAASLIHVGQPLEEVVGILMEAARKVGDLNWNWRAEEKKIRDLCSSAQKKFPPKEPVSHETAEEVIDLGEVRAKRKAKAKATAVHIVLAEAVLAAIRHYGEDLMFVEQGPYRYDNWLWRLQDDKSLRTWLDKSLEKGAQVLRLESTNKLIGEARGYLLRLPELHRKDVRFDAHGCVPTQSGLVDPRSGLVKLSQVDHYCTWRVPFVYDPAATCPLWLQMLADVFADRSDAVQREYISLVQEWLGMGLVDAKAKALSCILFFQGGTDYGKSEIIDVLAGLFGSRRNTTPIDMLDKTHGLTMFARRLPWVLPEAFDQGKWHLSSVTKALASGEPIQINIKNGSIFDHAFTGPIIWGANSDPQFKEATAAITNRLLIVPCRRKFDPNNPVGAAIIARAAGLDKPSQLVLRDEMPGVLAWAVEGLLRAKARGYFLRPEESRIAAEAVQEGSNIVLKFVKDCVAFDPNGMVSVPDFAAAFASWWAEVKGSERGVPGSESVSKALKALAEPRVAFDLKDNSRRYYAGVALNTEGLRYWSNAVTSDAFVFQSRKASTTPSDGSPNRTIPATWSGKAAIEAMTLAHAKSVTVSGDSYFGELSPVSDSEKLSPQLSPQLSSTQTTDPPEDIPF